MCYLGFFRNNSSGLLFYSNFIYIFILQHWAVSWSIKSMGNSALLTRIFFTKFFKVFFEVTDIHSENSFVLILPNVLTENLQTTNRTHIPFSNSPCVLLTEMSRDHVCVVRPPDLEIHRQYICCLPMTITRYYQL